MNTSVNTKLCVVCNRPRDTKHVLDNAIPDHCGKCSYEVIRDNFGLELTAKQVVRQITGLRDPDCKCALCIGAFN